MGLNVDLDLARIQKSLAEVQSGLGTPMAVTPKSDLNERIAALANAVSNLAQVVARIAAAQNSRRKGQ